ncbi:MAG: AAA family ATPase, partial [Halanaerobiales bacterium]
EKAHPDVFNILLQILEDGQLTDSSGRKVDFKNTVVIMTSNVGANLIERETSLGFKVNDDEEAEYVDMKERVMAELRRTFRPEFLNRLDEIIVFHALNKDHIKEIVNLMLKDLSKRLELNEIKIEVTEKAKSKLVEDGFDSQYGARPLRRSIQRLVENPLSEKILAGIIKNGDTVEVDEENGDLVFTTIKKVMHQEI